MKKIYCLIVVLFTFSHLQSQIEGTWVMAPEAGAFAVGPALGDFSWFSSSADDVTTRACFFDDKFVFNSDGSFQNIQDGETWLEPWQGVMGEMCGTPIAPHDGSNAATWTYDATAGTFTLSGVGAHVGIAKVVNGAEIAAPTDAPASITYPVVFDGNDRMIIDINFGAGFWHFVLIREGTGGSGGSSVLDGTTWVMAPEAGAFAVGPALNDFSWFSSSAADVDTRACFFDDKFVFNADGSFENVQDGETWLEPWQGAMGEMCGTPIAPHDGSNAATWSYDAAAGTITLNGMGAHIGISKVINGGELSAPGDAPMSITYPVIFDGDDRMIIDISIGAGFWHFVLVKEGSVTNPAVELEGTTWVMAPEAGALAVGPAIGDFSWFSSTMDDVTTR
ncbi:MAG: glycoside hydrolase family 16 protein, partial [Bacteroidota bacterium]